MKYGREAFRALLDFDDSRLEARLVMKDDGIWVRPLEQPVEVVGESEAQALLAHPTGNLDEPALPFPFDAEQFRAFCESAPLFEWETITARFTNDDESLDVPALEKLRSLNPTAAALVRQYLRNPKIPSELPPGSSDSAASPLDALAARMYPGGAPSIADAAKRPLAGPKTLTATRGLPSPTHADRAERKRGMTVPPSGPSVVRQRRAGPPNWEHWRTQTHAEAWQVVALSLNCEPVSWDELPDGDLENPAVYAAFGPDFGSRLRAVVQELDGHDPREQISLHMFAMGATKAGWTIPAQFPRWSSEAVVVDIGGTPRAFANQARYDEYLALQRERWSQGLYTMAEAAVRLQELNDNVDAVAILGDMEACANQPIGHRDKLQVMHPDEDRKGRIPVTQRRCRPDSDLVTDEAMLLYCQRAKPEPLRWRTVVVEPAPQMSSSSTSQGKRSDEEVAAIVNRYQETKNMTLVGEEFSISRQRIGQILDAANVQRPGKRKSAGGAHNPFNLAKSRR